MESGMRSLVWVNEWCEWRQKKAFSQTLLHRISPPIEMYCNVFLPLLCFSLYFCPHRTHLWCSDPMHRDSVKREKFAFVRRGSWCWLAGMIHYVKRVPLKISFSIMFKNAGSHTPDVCLSFLLIPTCWRLVGGVGWLGCVVCVFVCVCVSGGCGKWKLNYYSLFFPLGIFVDRAQDALLYVGNIFLAGNKIYFW